MAKVRYEPIVSFKPHPWQMAPLLDRSPTMLLTGGMGGGKSMVAANKIHGYCLHYPGSVALVLRKVRSTMPNSTIAFLRESVIGDDPRVVFRPSEFRFDYKNGSKLVWGGMADDEQRQHIRSIGHRGGVDIAWLEEAIQFEDDDYDEVPGRMRGKASDDYYDQMYDALGNPANLSELEFNKHFNADGSPRLTGWRQTILTTNPDAPGHWINIRLIENNEATVYRSTAFDNPSNPADYLQRILAFTGVKYKRYVLGLWVQSEQMVFDGWTDAIDAAGDHGGNITYAADYVHEGGEVLWWVDDGYAGVYDARARLYTARSHPRTFLFVQKRANGTLAVFDEHYAIEEQAPDHIQAVMTYSDAQGYARPSRVVFDRAAVALGGALRRAQFATHFNAVPVDESVKEVREYIAADKNGVRRLIMHPRCHHARHDMNSYARNPNTNKIIKQHDHACLVAGTMVETIAGLAPIEKIRAGDLVMTRKGYRPVDIVVMTNSLAETYTLTTDDGRRLTGTGNHPVFTENGPTPLSNLRPGDTITVSNYIGDDLEAEKWQDRKKLFTRGFFLGDTQTQKTGRIGFISSRVVSILSGALDRSIGRYGKTPTGPFHRAGLSTTGTTTHSTTLLTILYLSVAIATINSCTATTRKAKNTSSDKERYWKVSGRWRLNGIAAKREENGTENTADRWRWLRSRSLLFANIVLALSSQLLKKPGSARISASRHLADGRTAARNNATAPGAETLSRLTNTNQPCVALARVAHICANETKEPVYNLAVAGEPEYFANGILVSNCDAIRYGVWDLVHGTPSEVQVAILGANGQPILVPIPGRPGSEDKIVTQRYGQVTVAHLGGAAV